MIRISVPWTTSRSSSARVSASRSKPATRDHSPMYIDGAYCACSAPIASSISGIDRSRALQQALAGQQRAVELALREDHTDKRSTRRAVLPAWSRALSVSV